MTESTLEAKIMELPKDIRLEIFGMKIKCCRCGINMLDKRNRDNEPQKWLEIKTGLKFCSRKCLDEVVRAFRSYHNDTFDALQASNSFITRFEPAGLCVLKSSDDRRETRFF